MISVAAIITVLLFLYLALGTAFGWPIPTAIGYNTYPGRYFLIELVLVVFISIASRHAYIRYKKKHGHVDSGKKVTSNPIERKARKILTISGMSCGHCIMKIESEIRDIPGVEDVHVDLLKGNAMVVGSTLNDAALAAAVVKAGYHVTGILGSR
ncbi:MAG: cation transporter [Spirochaetota bacterium]